VTLHLLQLNTIDTNDTNNTSQKSKYQQGYYKYPKYNKYHKDTGYVVSDAISNMHMTKNLLCMNTYMRKDWNREK
jgi:hypothetical protein